MEARSIAEWINQTGGMQEHLLAELCPNRSTLPPLAQPQQSDEALVWAGEMGGGPGAQGAVVGGRAWQGTAGDKLHQHGEVQVPVQSPRQGMCSHR